MICWMYPGQPLKYLPEHPDDNDFNEISNICINKAGFDLVKCAAITPDISSTVCMQVYGVAMSLYHTRQLTGSGIRPDMITQHSMGIYPALVACSVISEEAAIEMTARVGACMTVMGKKDEYMLGCVIGLSAKTVSSLISTSGVYIANFNTSKHLLLAGRKSDLLPLLDTALAAGAFSVSSYNCDAPLHTPLMSEVSAGLKSVFAEYNYSSPAIPLVSHKGEQLENTAQTINFLHDELLQPVYWDKTIAMLRSAGIRKFIEVGAGDSLKKFNRWIESEQEAQ